MDDVRLLDVRIDSIDREGLEQMIFSTVRDGQARMYQYVNVHAVNLARTDQRFRGIINGATVTYCDGEGLRVGARLLGRRLPPRTVLTYWVWDLCRLMEERGLSAYFLGGRQPVVDRAVSTLRCRYPKLKVAGWHHGFFEKRGSESKVVVDEINRASPDILFVGFGMPIQEYWISENLSSLSAGIVLPAGSMIDYIAGEKKPAPPWMANHGLEWFYRFMHEPRRLWKRYLLGNPLFLIRILGHRLRFGGL
ncbi:MAG TPA: WecB/TagA/CpsF family glycosyltransferase [Bacteroidota bacterium]|nr:WecB/TagA/CpsF family glycosyltransferase [Bacteroidota bacterium]